MTRHFIVIAIIIALSVAIGGLILSSGPGPAIDSHTDSAEHDEHDGEHEDEGVHVQMSDDTAQRAGVTIEDARTATIRETISVMGRVMLDPRAVARVGARFPGAVREIDVAVGDEIDSGQTLAVIESSESLQRYPLKSSVSGVVVKINGTVGDVIADTPLLEIVNTSRIWAEFHVFPKDIEKVSPGQPILIHASESERSAPSYIDTVLPVADEATQSVVARAPLDNPDGTWTPGIFIRGDIAVATSDVPIAVRTSAIQTMDGERVIFVRENGAFEVRTVLTGASDHVWTEIVDGMVLGEFYAAANSFLLKAELGKASAEHSH